MALTELDRLRGDIEFRTLHEPSGGVVVYEATHLGRPWYEDRDFKSYQEADEAFTKEEVVTADSSQAFKVAFKTALVLTGIGMAAGIKEGSMGKTVKRGLVGLSLAAGLNFLSNQLEIESSVARKRMDSLYEF